MDVPADSVPSILEGKSITGNINARKPYRGNGEPPKKEEERAAMTRHDNGRNGPKADRVMIDSGTKYHITPFAPKVQDMVLRNVEIALADDSPVRSSHSGIRKVSFGTDDGIQNVSLSNTLVVPDAGMSLLSVPDLTLRGIGELFMPGFGVLYDLRDEFRILGYAEQEKDGLFYFLDDVTTNPPSSKKFRDR